MMDASRHLTVLGCIGLYMLLCIGIGVWALKRTKSTKDFFVAGRNLGVFVTSIAIFASLISGFAFVGGPGLVYRAGMGSMWMAYAGVVGVSAKEMSECQKSLRGPSLPGRFSSTMTSG